eukprot:jgi/Galph1/1006/GphlegSOOS_G5747.1
MFVLSFRASKVTYQLNKRLVNRLKFKRAVRNPLGYVSCKTNGHPIKYVCKNCEYQTVKWLGRCPRCLEWNSLEVLYHPSPFTKREHQVPQGWYKMDGENREVAEVYCYENISKSIREQGQTLEERMALNNQEISRVFGGGVVKGSVTLLGGDPGVGKSTLALQISVELLESTNAQVFYISGEESVQQLVGRINRLNKKHFSRLHIVAEANIERVRSAIEEYCPVAVILDSIQTCFSTELASGPGTVSQVRECAAKLTQIAKDKNIAMFLIGHVTKSGDIAGPKVLEHIVDTVLYLEGEKYAKHRILRCVKNRFGSTSEIAVFEMKDNGLVEVLNPSELFLSLRRKGTDTSKDNSSSSTTRGLEGSAVVATMEGTRAILVEVQALAFRSALPQPRRTANGFDLSRLHVLLAVLSKRLNYPFSTHDVYVNVVGGFRIQEPCADLAAAVGLVSSLCEVLVRTDTIFLGEVGLCGELRSVAELDRRIIEGEKLGFSRFICPAGSQLMKISSAATVIECETLHEALVAGLCSIPIATKPRSRKGFIRHLWKAQKADDKFIGTEELDTFENLEMDISHLEKRVTDDK